MTGIRSRNLRRAVMVVLLAVAVVSAVTVRGSSLPVPASAEEINTDLLEPGDILSVDIYRGWSQGGYWDHMAVYSEDPYPGVVEATYNLGVTYTPLAPFLDRDWPAAVSVRRLTDIPDRDEVIARAVENALAEVGTPFDYAATATLPWKINERNLHCSEAVWRAFKAAGVDLDSNGGPLVYPDDIYFSPKLTSP